MPLLNTLQYKQCLCILTLPKCKHNLLTRFMQNPDLHNLQTSSKNIKRVASGCKGSFCQCKNEKHLQT